MKLKPDLSLNRMNIQKELQEIGLDQENSIVIGSGILNALNIRDSQDIDLIINQDLYIKFKADGSFKIAENHGKEVLVAKLFEIGTSWEVLGRIWNFSDLMSQTQVIDDVRYITLDFLLKVKKSWMHERNPRQKDQDDITLIEKYMQLK
ncbi:MAG TPA: hypothetical protein VHQ41_03295 [Patescibacteria group bacterium]|nr:hypothetical protein [Patescibacteria group bacterium]